MSGGLVMVMDLQNERKNSKVSTHKEGVEICQVESHIIIPSKYVFNIRRFGDSIPMLMLQFTKTPFTILPDHYPFLFIKTIHLESRGHTILNITGLQLWCLVCTLPLQQQTDIKKAATRGIATLKDLIPSLHIVLVPYSQIVLNVEIDEERFESLSKQKINAVTHQIGNICDIPFDLARLCTFYMPRLDISSLTLLQPNVFLDNGFRKKLFEKDRHSEGYCKNKFVELNGSGNVTFENASQVALQINILVENAKIPGMFYTPREKPVEEIEIKIMNIPLQKGGPDLFLFADKLLHNIPLDTLNIAHYTWTFQTFEQFKNGQGFLTTSPTYTSLRVDNISVFVKLSPHIDQNSKIICWVKCIDYVEYSTGTLAPRHY
jgi:hypothetical protein